MDRDNRWDRVEAAYNLLASSTAAFEYRDPVEALLAAYERGETDEFVKPTLVTQSRKNSADPGWRFCAVYELPG